MFSWFIIACSRLWKFGWFGDFWLCWLCWWFGARWYGVGFVGSSIS